MTATQDFLCSGGKSIGFHSEKRRDAQAPISLRMVAHEDGPKDKIVTTMWGNKIVFDYKVNITS